MILRKPYALFIKHFKLIHVILTLLICFLMYRTTLVIVYFTEFLASGGILANPNTATELFNFFIFLVPLLVILISILVLSVLFLKKKPFLFYVLNIIMYTGIMIMYSYVYNLIGQMEEQIISVRVVRLARDFMVIIFVIEFITVIRTFIYSTGFNIKKFNFGDDLAELEATEADREEFEVELEVDINKAHRHVRKRTRFMRYVYHENKFLIDMGLLILFALTIFLIYFNLNIYRKTYKEGMAFRTKEYSMKINKSYITTKNYKDKEIIQDKKSLVVIELELKKQGIAKQVLNRAKTQLVIGKNKYYYINTYRDALFDLGRTYQNEDVPREFTKYILVYEIPNKDLKEKMTFKYLDDINYLKGEMRPKYINVSLKPQNINNIDKEEKYKLGEELNFKNSVLGDTKMTINRAQVREKFKIEYNFCVDEAKEECYPSFEYLKANVFNVNRKALLYLNGLITWDERLSTPAIENIYNFFRVFGSLEYEINNEIKTQNLIVKEVTPLRIKRKNDYYLEVNNEITKANKIFLVLRIRNVRYYYQLK